MKKLLFFSLVTGCGFCLSCNNEKGGMSATAKKNMEVNAAITKAYMSGDFSKMGDYIAKDAIDHGGETGDIKGLDSIVAQMKVYHAQMPNAKSETIKEMADDEYVMTWSKVSGDMGGKPMNMTSIDVAKFKDGKAVEHWIYMDPKDMMKMMESQGPPPGGPEHMPADTTKTK